MPIYEYECQKCGEVTEVMQRITDDPLTTCETCGGPIKRLISHTTFVLKGTGWYATDYAGKNGSNGSGGKRSAETNLSDSSAKKETSAPKKESAEKSTTASE